MALKGFGQSKEEKHLLLQVFLHTAAYCGNYKLTSTLILLLFPAGDRGYLEFPFWTARI